MNIYEIERISDRIKDNSYVGRGIVIGKSEDSKKAVIAYFIMGRSENSRNRVFVNDGSDVMIKAFDESKVTDPSLIIYYPLKNTDKGVIVTNGDQTDTVYDYVSQGKTFEDGLFTREFEPDDPNWTPRISGYIPSLEENFAYKMSILKSADAKGTYCNRFFYNYNSLAGLGHFIHTYMEDGNPIPTFCGEPERVYIPSDIDEFADEIWSGLDKNNKISLFVRYFDLKTGEIESRMINKQEEK